MIDIKVVVAEFKHIADTLSDIRIPYDSKLKMQELIDNSIGRMKAIDDTGGVDIDDRICALGHCRYDPDEAMEPSECLTCDECPEFR